MGIDKLGTMNILSATITAWILAVVPRAPRRAKRTVALDGASMFNVELEWNPFSTASRAARADRAGRVRDALVLYVKADQPERVLRCLRYALPEGPARTQLLRAADEWLQFWQGLARARQRRLPTHLVDDFTTEAQAAADLLWRIADNIAAALTYKVKTPRFQESMQRELGKVQHVGAQLGLARTALADLELAGGGEPLSVQRTTHRLEELRKSVHALREAVREVEDL